MCFVSQPCNPADLDENIKTILRRVTERQRRAMIQKITNLMQTVTLNQGEKIENAVVR